LTRESGLTWSDLKVGDVLMTLGGDDGDEPCALISIECIKSLSLKQRIYWKKGTFLNLVTAELFELDLIDRGVRCEILRAT